MIKEAHSLAFLNGGGKMGMLARTKDWSTTAIGPPHTWPQSLRTSVSLLLNSQFPMFVWWGKELVTIYNDAYIPIAGEKHPELLGKSGRVGWSEIWEDLDPLVEKVFSGTSTWAEDQLLNINRHGYIEETYFTFSYSPILDDTGSVIGLFCACIETTEKVLATRSIQQSERNLRNTILQSPVAMCIFSGPLFEVAIANDRMYELWGRGAAEMLHKPIFTGLPEARNQGLETVLQDVYNTGTPFFANERPVTLPRNRKTETIFINFVYQPFRDGDGAISGIIAVAVDVTEQVVARKKIEESEQELQKRVEERTSELVNQKSLLANILKNSSNGISVTEMIRDEAGNVIDAATILANDAAVRFTGLPEDIYLTQTAVELDPNILSSAYGQTCLSTLATGKPSITQYFLEPTTRWLELTISKMDDNHLIHIFTDITPIKETQLQVEKVIEDLKRTNANLEEFAYAASHDMKEPIRKIRFFADRLQRELSGKLTEDQSRLLERMELAAKRSWTLIDDLLAYSQATKGVSDVEEVDLNRQIQDVLEDLELEIHGSNASIKIDPLPVVTGNKRQFQQLFQNLISNALKYKKQDTTPEIYISATLAKGKEAKPTLPPDEGNKTFHLIAVRDNGIGFAPEDTERIFNVFTRLYNTVEHKGTGVGLSIAQRVVENHKGHIWAESRPNEGATFKILLPAV